MAALGKFSGPLVLACLAGPCPIQLPPTTDRRWLLTQHPHCTWQLEGYHKTVTVQLKCTAVRFQQNC